MTKYSYVGSSKQNLDDLNSKVDLIVMVEKNLGSSQLSTGFAVSIEIWLDGPSAQNITDVSSEMTSRGFTRA